MERENKSISLLLYQKPWLAFFITTIAIFIGAKIGSLLGLKPTGISVLWPATGIALASLLLFGNKMIPAVFLGNFIYNFLNLYTLLMDNPASILNILSTATVISLGSLLQAFLGAVLIRHFSPLSHFYSVRDQYIFLLYGGFLTCLTASTIGVAALHTGGFIASTDMLKTWLTFWLGDTFGVYVMTPLIVVWLSDRIRALTKSETIELVIAIVCFIGLSTVLFTYNYPLSIFFIPIVIWATIRFYMHGATLSILIVTTTMIIATSFGYGALATSKIAYPLVLLDFFILTIVSSAFFLAAALQERETARLLLKKLNQNLENTVGAKNLELDEIQEKLGIKERLASLGGQISSISLKLKAPLTYVHGLSSLSLDFTELLENCFNKSKHLMDKGTLNAFENALQGLKTSLIKLSENEKQANQIVNVMIQHSMAEYHNRSDYRLLNMSVLLDRCIDHINKEMQEKYNGLDVVFEKHYDKNAVLSDVIPEDLEHAFTLLLDSAVHAIFQNKYHAIEFIPLITITTEDYGEYISIVIKDNRIQNLQGAANNTPDTLIAGLAMVHDIIVNEHQGNIGCIPLDEGFFEVIVQLPKTRQHAQTS